MVPFNNEIVGNPKKIKSKFYAGAFDGKHIDRFIKNSDNSKIYAFEPSPKIKKLKKNI